ncbi:MAG: hypothetical protein D6733_07440 [Methanobacteriota archaeon]|nr:MAG: hypothetical protein D6733_07440 [Euryarchaeota archaeon]
MEETAEKTKFDRVVRTIEAEMTVNAEIIELIAAGEYLLQLVDPGIRPQFEELLKDVNGIEEVKEVIGLIKKQIGQQAAKKLFGF